MSSKFTESIVEEATIQYFQDLGYTYLPGPDIAHDGLFAERLDYSDVILRQRLKDALTKINPSVPAQAVDDAIKIVARADSPTLIVNNRSFHKQLTDGIDIQYRKYGQDIHDKVWLFDFDNPDNNDWLVTNQFTIVENNVNRRPEMSKQDRMLAGLTVYADKRRRSDGCPLLNNEDQRHTCQDPWTL